MSSQWWGEPAAQFDLVSGDLADPAVQQFIVINDGTPFAYLQCYDPEAWAVTWVGAQPQGTRGIDQFIGEPEMIDRGHGSAFIRAFIERLLASGVPRVHHRSRSGERARRSAPMRRPSFQRERVDRHARRTRAPDGARRHDRLLPPRNRLRARPLHHRPARRQARRRDRVAQPLAAPAARRAAARGGAAEEHPDDRPDRRRQDRNLPAARAARRRAVHQGRGHQVHRGRLCRPRRRADRARSGGSRHRADPRAQAQGRAGPRRAGRRGPRGRCPGRAQRQRYPPRRPSARNSAPAKWTTRKSRSRCSPAAAACRCSRSPACPARRWAPSTSATFSASSAAAAPRRGASPSRNRTTILVAEESDKLLDQEPLVQEAIHSVEQNGIVFLDEIDKISRRARAAAAPTCRARACSATCCR